MTPHFITMLWVLAAVLAMLQGGRTFQIPPHAPPIVNFNDQAADQIHNQYSADLDTFRGALHDWWRTQTDQDPNIARIDVHRMIRRRDAANAVTRAEALIARSGQEPAERNEEPRRRGDRSSQKSRLITAILTERPGATSGQGTSHGASEGAVPRRVRSQRRCNAPAHASSSSAVPTPRAGVSARSEHQAPATTFLPVKQRGGQSMVMWSPVTDNNFRGMPPKAREDMSKSIAAWAEASQSSANVHVLGIGPSVLPHHVSVHHQLYDEGMNKISNPKISEVPHVMTHF
ncbi:hypothetical protein IE81DRAFT_347680 [Ceraceosorus guamensis]|uniref:Uncharacterized protein n=1 Tax=Ceraceosorus guamensis TaxID=1522189 RepID=A0A316W0P2_9BASI|nr:hypothetical protein IE81DRAFT_347680 [Ceraceosorus guamensis]PWN42111.1 hypothetical protein IE81DRAFT_347680 [Ceraceosorus guamensis]